jgi:hypothetical protein
MRLTEVLDANSVRRDLIAKGLLVPREEDLPWTTKWKRAYALQKARRQVGATS